MPQLRRLLALALVLAAFAAPMSPPDVSLAADSPGQIAVVFTDEQTPLEVAEFAQRHSLELRVVPEEPTRVASFLAPNIDSALAAVRRDTNVLAADIDEVATLATNDPLYDDMWWLRNVGQSFTIGLIVKVISAIYGTFTSATLPAESGNDIAWEQARSLPACNGVPCTGAGVLVGVVDTGIDASHPDLAGGVVTAGSRSYIPGYGPLDDDNGHGTFIAGLIAATANNGIGMTGVAPDASLLPMKAADVTGIHSSAIRRARSSPPRKQAQR